MKRILCFIESLGSGGAERQLTGLAVMLKQQGYDVEVCYYVKKEFYLPYLQDNGTKGVFLSEATNPSMRFFALLKHIKAYKPDTIVSYSASPSMISCLLKFLGLKFNLIVSERSNTQKITIREKLLFFFYRWANYIVPNSFSQGAFIEKRFPKLAKKIKVITNYVDTELFSPSDKQECHDKTKMLCVGRMGPEKNICGMIEAIGKVVESGLVIRVDWYGQDLNDNYSIECYKAIKEHHLDQIFVFHAPISNIQEEYNKADVFCLPSIYEGFPNVLCEAMSCGLPVLCSRVCDNPNIAQEGENGFLFDPNNVDEIAEAIIRFLKLDDNVKKRMGQKGREIALSLFSSDVFVKKYLEIV